MSALTTAELAHRRHIAELAVLARASHASMSLAAVVAERGRSAVLPRAAVSSAASAIEVLSAAFPGDRIAGADGGVLRDGGAAGHWLVDLRSPAVGSFPGVSPVVAYVEDDAALVAAIGLPYFNEAISAMRGGGAALANRALAVAAPPAGRPIILNMAADPLSVGVQELVSRLGGWRLPAPACRITEATAHLVTGRIDAFALPGTAGSQAEIAACALVIHEAGGVTAFSASRLAASSHLGLLRAARG